MTTESKRGSNGGNARSEKLSKEQRKAIASEAAAKRWDAVRAAKEKDASPDADPKPNGKMKPEPVPVVVASPVPVPVTPEPTPIPPHPYALPVPPTFAMSLPKTVKTKKKAKLPREFGAAHSYAEKRLAEAIRERAEAAGRVAALNAEIPSLLQIINALKTPGNPIATQYPPQQAYTAPAQPAYIPTQEDAQMAALMAAQKSIPIPPPIPMAHGGAVGGGFAPDPNNMPEDAFLNDSFVGGGGWK